MTKDLTDGAGVEAKIQSAQVAPIESKEGDGQPPFGRPTKYDPIYCDMVEEEMAKGFSLTAFAGIIGVARSIINEWMAEKSRVFRRRQSREGKMPPPVEAQVIEGCRQWRERRTIRDHHFRSEEYGRRRLSLTPGSSAYWPDERRFRSRPHGVNAGDLLSFD